jgi:hypothetical protein
MESGGSIILITNSTFFQNAVLNDGDAGGALYVHGGTCTLVNCTIASNSAMGGTEAFAGGIYNQGGVGGIVLLLNTIVAGNSASADPDLQGAFATSGVNLIGNSQGATGLSIYDFQNVPANLGPLQNNGGSTPTCTPLPGSVAIGNGASAGAPMTDQRGVPRPQNGGFDIGAVQVVTNSPIFLGFAMNEGAGFNLNTIFDETNSYRLQASINLTTWITLVTNKTGGALQFMDTAATNLNYRFYRTQGHEMQFNEG